MRHTELRLRARAILSGVQCVSPASVYDALSARAAELSGFTLGLLSGSISSATTLDRLTRRDDYAARQHDYLR